jgi:predicted acetyltransferase
MDIGSPQYRTVRLDSARRAEVLDLDTWASPSALTPEETSPLPLSWDRTVGVEAPDGSLVALHSSYPFTRFPVPGSRLPVAGLTWVGVHPQHRRRGILTSMVRQHLAACRTRGEPVSALFAAEMPIYGRFGYGLAARGTRMTLPRGAALRDVAGSDSVELTIEHAVAARHSDLIATVHDAAGDRPGWATRETPALREVFLADPPHARGGAESQRIVIARVAGVARGYALFRREDRWAPEGPRGIVKVREIVALEAAVARALWGVLVDLDLMATIETPVLAPDDAVHHLLVDPRAGGPRLVDNVWVRIVDLPAALAGRRYSAPTDLVIDVADALLPDNAGRWRLTTHEPGSADGSTESACTATGGASGPAAPYRARVGRTTDAADLRLDVRELGAAYLGGTSLRSLASAGLVRELTPGALDRATTAFSWPLAPVCSWTF